MDRRRTRKQRTVKKDIHKDLSKYKKNPNRKRQKAYPKKTRVQKARPGSGRRPAQRRRPRKTRRIWPILAAAVLFPALAGFLLWYLSFDRLNLEDYVAVRYTGYDTEGTVELSMQEVEEYEPFLQNVKIELLSENGALQNGDALDIHFIYDEKSAKEQKLRICSDACQIEVRGLPRGKELTTDALFQHMGVSYEGTAPELSVSVSNESTDDFFCTVSYEIIDKRDYYDLGDTFLVRADFSQEEAIACEYIVDAPQEGFVKQYTVEGADRYVRDAAQLSQEQLGQLSDVAVSLFGDATEYGLRIFSEANLMPIWVHGKTTFVWSNPRLLSAYLNVLKPEYFGASAQHDNDLKLVYMATLSQADGVACDAEVVVQFTNLIQKADGTFDLALDSAKIIAASYKNSHIRDLVTDTYAEEYEAVKIE